MHLFRFTTNIIQPTVYQWWFTRVLTPVRELHPVLDKFGTSPHATQGWFGITIVTTEPLGFSLNGELDDLTN